MKKSIIPILVLLSSVVHAHTLKNSNSFGESSYRDVNLSGTWSLNEKDYLVTTLQNTLSSGSTTNEYKAGVGSQINDDLSYYISGYYRSEPNSIRAMGIDPSITHGFDDLLIEDQTTSITVGLMVSKFAADLDVVGTKKTIEENFYSGGISAQFAQDLTDDLSLSVGGSFYQYTNITTQIPAIQPAPGNKNLNKVTGNGGGTSGKQSGKAPNPNRNRRMNLINVSDSVLSTSGYPKYSAYVSTNWNFLDNWNTGYSLSSSTSNYENTTNYYSSVSIDHTFLKSWNAELEYSWSNSGFTTSGVGLSYKW